MKKHILTAILMLTALSLSAQEKAVVSNDNSQTVKGRVVDAATGQPLAGVIVSAYGNLICCYLNAYQKARPLTRVVEEIESDIISHCADCDYRLDEFLRAQPFSYDYLRKLFQKELGMTPHKYLTNRRLQSAAEMLVNAEINGSAVMDVARQCGFRDSLYFS